MNKRAIVALSVVAAAGWAVAVGLLIWGWTSIEDDDEDMPWAQRMART